MPTLYFFFLGRRISLFWYISGVESSFELLNEIGKTGIKNEDITFKTTSVRTHINFINRIYRLIPIFKIFDEKIFFF
jgi:hypothetical protein